MSECPDQDVDPPDCQVWAPIHQGASDQAVATPDVEYGSAARHQASEMVDESLHPPLRHVTAMDSGNEAHCRRIPSMVAEKLDMTVSKPKMEKITPGITHRMVQT